ncbi:hypothetical protein IS481_08820 [Caldimonas thermodepolymerans]|jgi:hypothetical protein|uniref:Uncharacterized protein n=1 Tax=Caldimonas thermodepolymerans TaxID=215580 RepID=A0A2S5T6T1_9BURK|nr:hypothetical protein [Caldimonas thermodepolymerans]PPE70690.1 hypothetical protein C1702_05980 [Caldimonas thermodepolymerans]QPC33221.1 hypothetical protein IS481_08820 [Caldimonas thermodepolymerans]RDH97543.1 hypothetical protein DES46_10856 [Caldimonas thermodepolymerans]TCP09955.1 hypothetical protein EV676_101539 [Caldimonas thermodepolymerans]UZG42660.1 hypothetical protein ONZ46_09440 [Caldimonas thermodepolymerans]
MFAEITGWLVAFKYPAGDTAPRWIEVAETERERALQLACALAAEQWPEAGVCQVVPVMDV